MKTHFYMAIGYFLAAFGWGLNHTKENSGADVVIVILLVALGMYRLHLAEKDERK